MICIWLATRNPVLLDYKELYNDVLARPWVRTDPNSYSRGSSRDINLKDYSKWIFLQRITSDSLDDFAISQIAQCDTGGCRAGLTATTPSFRGNMPRQQWNSNQIVTLFITTIDEVQFAASTSDIWDVSYKIFPHIVMRLINSEINFTLIKQCMFILDKWNILKLLQSYEITINKSSYIIHSHVLEKKIDYVLSSSY